MKQLRTIKGNFLAYKRLEPGTFQHADQLITAGRKDSYLRRGSWYTADGEVYTSQKGKVLWGITRGAQNKALNLMDVSDVGTRDRVVYDALTTCGNYYTYDEEPFTHPDTAVVEVRGLHLRREGCDESSGYFTFKPEKTNLLSSQQQVAIRRIFGGARKTDFEQNMTRLAREKVEPRVRVLMAGYIREKLKGSRERYMWRASHLSRSSDSCDFDATLYHLHSTLELCGVPLPEPQFAVAYHTILSHPEALTATEAAGLAQLVTEYFQNKIRNDSKLVP